MQTCRRRVWRADGIVRVTRLGVALTKVPKARLSPGLRVNPNRDSVKTPRKGLVMQILHPWTGSLQEYEQSLSDPDRYRPGHCPQCQAQQALIGHGFYVRTLVDCGWDGA